MRIPTATYRFQFSSTFRFQDAKALIPYLSRIGISDVYASPIFKAHPGSTHGYDVTDPGVLNPELGTPEDFEALVAEVQAHGMGWLQDIVPNHMAYSSDNWMLMDLFENGSRSRFHEFFDIFRDHPDLELQTRVLAPFLGGSLEELLGQGEIKLTLDRDGLAIRYFDWRFPVYLASYDDILWRNSRQLGGSMAGDDPHWQTFATLGDTFIRLSNTDDSPEKRRELAEAKRTLAQLYNDDPMLNVYIDGVLEAFNRPPTGPVEQSPLTVLLDRQVFKLVPWQVAHEQINYRRFFYISDFIATRVQDPQVFETMHEKVFELVQAGVFTGLRIDHIDGLYNPRSYLARLREALPECYLVVEKILELYEFLPSEWPIEGTSGYQFCNYLNGLFCQCENEEAFTTIYHQFIRDETDYERLLYEEKKKILEWRMGGEVAYLTHLAMQLSPSDDPEAAESMRQALIALMAAFPVYRTYIDALRFTDRDRGLLIDAIDQARERCIECRPNVDRVIELLLPDPLDEPDPVSRASHPRGTGASGPRFEGETLSTDVGKMPVTQARRHFLMRFQQFTGPAMAKGFEDTLLYVYNRFLSLNEVGGAPNRFGLAIEEFHKFNQRRARDWPHAMNATSTHDSKRGEDVRARLNVLSEIPDRWQQAVTDWARMNEPHKQGINDVSAPHPNDEYLLYQTLVGALPFDGGEAGDFLPRITDYFLKAVREAKAYTNWVDSNEPYENACRQFVERILADSADNRFRRDFTAFQQEIAEYGIYNSLSHTALKITCPGVPDFYRGADLWELSLVDPDNRRPVDFEKRVHMLHELQEEGTRSQDGFLEDLVRSRKDGRIKLFLILKALYARTHNRELFDLGDYVPASVQGSRAEHIVAFFRTPAVQPEGRTPSPHGLIVVPRFLTSLVRPGEPPLGRDVWQDTRIILPDDAPRDWHDAITCNTLSATDELHAGDILSRFPVSILLSRSPGLAP